MVHRVSPLFVARRIAVALCCALPLVAQAAGLGSLNVRSALGQRLLAEIEVVALQPGEEEALTVRLAGSDVFRQAGVEFNPVLSTVRFAVERRGGKTLIRMTSSEPLNEPFLDLLLEIQWPAGRLVREYTFLLDPPGYAAPPSVAAPTSPAMVTPPAAVAAVVPPLVPKPPVAELAASPAPDAPVPPKEPLEAASATAESALAPSREAAAETQPVVPTPAVEEKPLTPVVESPAKPEPEPEPVAAESKSEAAADEPKPAARVEDTPAAKVEEPVAKAEAAVEVEPRPEAAVERTPRARVPEKARGFEVRRGDTLGEVAQWNLPEGATLQQMLIALYRANPKAFLRENINLVRAGAILNLPEAEVVSAIDPKEAQRLVGAHIAAFADYRRSLSVAAAASASEATAGQRSTEGKIDAAPSKPAAPEPKDQVKLSKADPVKPGAAPSRAAGEDDAVARERALKETQSRVSELDKNVSDLKTLLELKNQQLAELEKKAKPAAAAAPVPPIPAKGPDAAKAASAAAIAPPPAQVPATATPQKPAATPSAAAKGGEPVKPVPPAPETQSGAGPVPPAPAKAAPLEAPKTVAETKAKPKPVPKPAATIPEPGLLGDLLDLDDPVTLGGLGAVMLALVGYGFYAVRRKRRAAKGQAADAGASGVSSVFNPTAQGAAGSPSVIMPSVGQASVGGMGADEVDPIAEADVYMAYGRDAQAEEILKEAIDKDPNRINVHEKLLEIYANRRDSAAFAQTMQTLRSLTGGSGPEWEKATVLGRSIDPSNSLYGGGGTSGSIDSRAGGGGSALDLDLDGGTAASGVAPDFNLGTTETLAEGSSSVDFDLGSQTGSAAEETDFTPEGTLIIDSSDAKAASAGLDFDLGASESAKSEDIGLNFELPAGFGAAPAAAEAAAASAAPSAPAEQGGGLDFDLKMDIGGEAGAAVGAAQEPMDLSSISLDLGDGGSSPAGGGDQKWQEVATKLDLAKAYQDMGDADGARELLNEVLRDGDAAQQNQAQERLASLT